MIHPQLPLNGRASGPAVAQPHAIEALALGLMGTALVLLTLALSVVPQRLAQRPASAGVILLRLDSRGQLRLWNHAVAPQQLTAVLKRLAQQRSDLRLRLVSDPQVPWGAVQQLVARLDSGPLPLELQLP
jgi:biopolymer transport protein ExbD